jgi:hypothetical protein
MSRDRRRVGTRTPKKLLLIWCEGEETEVNYFNAYKSQITNLTVQVKSSPRGGNAQYFVTSCAKETRQLEQRQGIQFDEVYCVFDKDHNSPADFNHAVITATQKKLIPIYSNLSFEWWYVLHFSASPTAHTQSAYEHSLSKALERPYKKADSSLFEKLQTYQPQAIQNAKAQHRSCCEEPPANQLPCTLVYKLVERLNQELPHDSTR